MGLFPKGWVFPLSTNEWFAAGTERETFYPVNPQGRAATPGRVMPKPGKNPRERVALRVVGEGEPTHAMITYKDIAFTAYPVTNMRKARKFYEGILGLKRSRVFSKNFIEYDIGRGTLVVACAPEQWKPSRHGTSAALEVKDLAAAVAHLRRRKVKFHIGPLDFPTCSMVAFRDPDGNVISLHQRKRLAKK